MTTRRDLIKKIATCSTVTADRADKMQELFLEIEKAENLSLGNIPKYPPGPNKPGINPIHNEIAEKVKLDPYDVCAIFETALASDNEMLHEALKKFLILAKLTTDPKNHNVYIAIAKLEREYQLAVDRYNQAIVAFERTKEEKATKIKNRIMEYKHEWIQLVRGLQEFLLTKPSRSSSNVREFALLDAIRESGMEWVEVAENHYKMNTRLVTSIGHKKIFNIINRSEEILEEYSHHHTKKWRGNAEFDELVVAFIEAEDLHDAALLLYSIFEREGLDPFHLNPSTKIPKKLRILKDILEARWAAENTA